MDIGSNVTNTGPYIETVRSLHQTVTALRIALEESKKEILHLKTKVLPIDSIEQSLTALAIENHALRRKLLDNNVEEPSEKEKSPLNETKHVTFEAPVVQSSGEDEQPDNLITTVEKSPKLQVVNTVTETEIPELGHQIQSVEEPASSEATKDIITEKPESNEITPDETKNINIIPSFPTFEAEEQQSEKLLVSPPADAKGALLENPENKNLKTDSQQSLTHITIKENVQPNLVDVKISPSKNIHKKKKSEQQKRVKEVYFTEIPQRTRFNSSVTETKKAKNEKRNTKKKLKLPVALSSKSVRSHKIRASVHIKAKTLDDKKISRSLDSLTIIKTPKRQLKLSKTTQFFDWNSRISCEIFKGLPTMTENNDRFRTEHEINSGNIDEDNSQNDVEPEVDDIELIFTTDDTKESDFKEQLVSIDSVERQNNPSGIKLLAPDQERSLDISDRELDDDVFGGSFDQENQDSNNGLQVYQLERDNSQLYNSKSDNSINQEEKSLRSYYSYQDSSFENKSMEKDESFDRFEERIRIVETDISKVGIQEVEYAGIRRNTCPNPLQYRPLLHREAINKGLNVKKSRPILAHSNAIRKESGAQTDISALPGSAWRSESSLAYKAHLGDNFTTLPSKFPLPGSRLRLSEKTTVEARRVLLSDIGFTSMVPELSRSADHLCPSALKPPVTSYGQFLRTPELYSPAYTSQRFTWTTATATPSDGSQSHSRYSINPLTPPVQTRRCSAPVSPSRRGTMKSTASRVRFANGSLPELRGDWTQLTADSGDSTDSLVEEAENYLRRSIDCILGSSRGTDYGESKRNTFRRASAPESASDNTAPQGWQPFLPRQPRDLKPDHWVKVITPEGKVKGGRVRYIGPVAAQVDQFVGVQLAVPEGHSDGTYNTRRYFQCEPYHGIFVPFKKVIMGWRP